MRFDALTLFLRSALRIKPVPHVTMSMRALKLALNLTRIFLPRIKCSSVSTIELMEAGVAGDEEDSHALILWTTCGWQKVFSLLSPEYPVLLWKVELGIHPWAKLMFLSLTVVGTDLW